MHQSEKALQGPIHILILSSFSPSFIPDLLSSLSPLPIQSIHSTFHLSLNRVWQYQTAEITGKY